MYSIRLLSGVMKELSEFENHEQKTLEFDNYHDALYYIQENHIENAVIEKVNNNDQSVIIG